MLGFVRSLVLVWVMTAVLYFSCFFLPKHFSSVAVGNLKT